MEKIQKSATTYKCRKCEFTKENIAKDKLK